MTIEKYGNTRNWAVRDDDGELICLTVYKKGAIELKRRFEQLVQPQSHQQPETADPELTEVNPQVDSENKPLRRRNDPGRRSAYNVG